MPYDIKEQLKALKENDQLNPDRDWVSKQRGLLLQQIKGASKTQEVSAQNVFAKVRSGFGQFGSMILPQGSSLVMRPIMTMVLVIGLAVGGWIATVSASYNSLPGDRLYKVKLATEKVQKAVTDISISDEESVTEHIERAKRRTEEIRDAVKKVKDDPKKKTKVNKVIKEVAVKDLKESLDSAEQEIQEMADNESGDVVKMAKEVSEEMSEMKKTLIEVANETSEGTEGVSDDNPEDTQETVDIMGETARAAEEVGINAVATAVDKKGEEEEVRELVKEMVGEKIEAFLESADALQEVNDELESAEDLLSETTHEASTSTVSKVEDAGDVAEDFAEEADQLLGENKLNEIMDVVREVTQTTNETEAVVVEVKKVVADVVAKNEEFILEHDASTEQSIDEVDSSDGQSTTGTVEVAE